MEDRLGLGRFRQCHLVEGDPAAEVVCGSSVRENSGRGLMSTPGGHGGGMKR